MLLKYVTPDLIISSYQHLEIDWLVSKDIRLILCDVDNTLVPHGESFKIPLIKEFVQGVTNKGIQVILISNNTLNKVKILSQELSIPVYSFALKPSGHTYRKIMKTYGVQANQIATLGDQLFTDVLGAKRMKMLSIYTNPLSKNDKGITKLNRFIEKMIFQKFEKIKKNQGGI